MKKFRIYDELYGFVELGFDEKEVVDTPVFQRLRRIRQLGLASLVYPGAEHTRFSHSIGVAYISSLLGEKLVRAGFISKDELPLLRIAALLHDIGHLPFGHALEWFYHGVEGYPVGKTKAHEAVSLAVIQRNPILTETLWRIGYDPREIAGILEGTHRRIAYTTILSSEVDADRIDYLLRDSLHTGVAYGRIDWTRIVDAITVVDDQVAVQLKGLQAIEAFYVARLQMYRTVYHHKTVTAFTLQLSRIYGLLAHEDPEVERIASIKGLLELAESEEYWLLDDHWIYERIRHAAKNRNDILGKLSAKFLQRRGPKLVYEKIAYTDNLVQAETSLDDIVEKLEACGVPADDTYKTHEVIKLLDKTNPLNVLVDNDLVPITEMPIPTIISSLRSYLVINRVYVEPEYAAKARQCIQKPKTQKPANKHLHQ